MSRRDRERVATDQKMKYVQPLDRTHMHLMPSGCEAYRLLNPLRCPYQDPDYGRLFNI